MAAGLWGPKEAFTVVAFRAWSFRLKAEAWLTSVATSPAWGSSVTGSAWVTQFAVLALPVAVLLVVALPHAPSPTLAVAAAAARSALRIVTRRDASDASLLAMVENRGRWPRR